MAQHLLGHLCRKDGPQVATQPTQEVEPHLHREGTALTLWKKVVDGREGGEEGGLQMMKIYCEMDIDSEAKTGKNQEANEIKIEGVREET